MVAAAGLSFVLVALLVTTASRAAFTATRENRNNNVSAASLRLTDDDSGTAMFNETNLTPGTPVERCIQVTYTGSVAPQPVKLYKSHPGTGDLAQYLDLTVDVGSGATAFPDCTGFSSSGNVFTGTLAAMPTTYVTGPTAWTPAGTNETRTFRFRIQVQDVPAVQGESANNFGFAWETRSG